MREKLIELLRYERHLIWDKKNGRGCPEVTHWMPLPEAPRGE